ncbi:CYFA0S12e00452g1_1 [Cyberlindnera fabianii]|uniref:Serine/threonine-protein kinase RAD53 n=1 Tax=Cyberlindnera fabianii TaxID=36022 RepID=A0A061B6I1_CYBFA|nr:CYFA0S12e00452g1_1 [Cyberlindnera fabianii]
MEIATQATQPTQATQANQLDTLTQENIDADCVCRLICTTGQIPNKDLKPQPNGAKEWTFGRNIACDISYQKTSRLSNRHFKIWSGENNVLIQDTSTNGTWVNKQRIVKGQNYILSQGDEISVGIGVPKDVVRFIVFFPKIDEKNDEKTEGIHKEFSIKDEVVGQGAFAIVKKAVERSTGKTFAVKIISKRKIMGNTDGVTRELEILRRLDHPGIVKLKGFYEDDDSYYLVMEFVSGGDLMDFVAAHGSVGEEAAKEITRQILEAIKYVHSLGISHRDLKPDNILIAQDDPVIVKITDFGLAKISNTGTFMKTFCGTLAYVAPEVIDGRHIKATDVDKYSSLVDMWSMGCLLYVILTAHLPFSGSTQDELYKQIRRGSYHEPPLREAGASAEARAFLEALLQVNPKDRLTASQALKHPWITSSSQLASQISLSQSQSQQQRLETEKKLETIDINAVANNEPSQRQETVFKVPAPPSKLKSSSSQPASQPSSSQIKALTDSVPKQIKNQPLSIIHEDHSFDRTSLIESGPDEPAPSNEEPASQPTSSQAPAGTRFTLVPKPNKFFKSSIHIPQGLSPFFIGRYQTCHRRIVEDRMSKIHCAFTKKRHPVGNSLYESPAQGLEDIWLADYSTNACYLNGMKIGKGKKVVVFAGDEIMLFNDMVKGEQLAFTVHVNDPTGLFNGGQPTDKGTRTVVDQDDFDKQAKPKIVHNPESSSTTPHKVNKRPLEAVPDKQVKRAALGKGDANSSFQTALA